MPQLNALSYGSGKDFQGDDLVSQKRTGSKGKNGMKQGRKVCPMVKPNLISHGLKGICTALAVALGFSMSVPNAVAQQPAAEQPKAAAKAPSGPEIKWLKFCEFSVTKKTDNSKAKVCLVHYEQRAADTGTVLVSAAIRQIEGIEKERFIVMVPLGVAIPPGLKVRVDKGDPIAMRYTLCHPQGCTAEGDATKDFVTKLKKGNKLYIAAINAFGRGFALPVSLKGFTKTYGGPPMEGKKVEEIRKVEFEKLRSAYQAQKKKNEAGKQPAAPKKAQ